jgi:hypothetical protein
MPNMSYCRFQNTLNDLRDCAEHLLDPLSAEEHRARHDLIMTMTDMLDNLGVTVEYSEVRAAMRDLTCSDEQGN